jgi:hypothetical protein
MEISGQIHAPAALFPGKETLVLIGYDIFGFRSRSGHGGEEKNSGT